jgi:uncharacterized integral membrane protein
MLKPKKENDMKVNTMILPKHGFPQYLVHCLSVGIAYAMANSLIAILLGSLSRQSATLENISVWMLTGTLVCMSFSPFIIRSTWSQTKTVLAVWAAMAFARSFGLGIEGALFKPASAEIALLGALTGTLIGLLVAWLSVKFLMPANGVPDESRSNYSWWRWTWRVLVVGLAYFLFYFIFGATNALLYTMNFYKDNPQYGLTLPPYGIIFMAQLLRGPLFGLGSLFIARSVNLPRRQLGLWLGLMLFVIGGFAPYMEITFRAMPLGFNFATLTEILFQNVLTGVVAASLFGSKQVSK